MFIVELTRARSYLGKVYASREKPQVIVPYQEDVDRLEATGYFTLVGDAGITLSTFQRDPSEIGGDGCNVAFSGHTAHVTGSIAYYPADESLGRTAGCRVGFEILPPAELEDVTNARYYYEDKTGLVKDDTAGDPRRFWWFPLVEEGVTEKRVTVDWDGTGNRPAETFVATFSDVVLLGPDEESPEPEDDGENLQDPPSPEPQGASLELDMPGADLTNEEIRKMQKEELLSLAKDLALDISGCKNNDERAAAIITFLLSEDDE